MKDLNYFPLNVESNIYGMTTLEFEDGTIKLLVASSDCQIYCIFYSKYKPQIREVEFTYIPNGARIISIGALKRGSNDFVIGITHSLASSTQKSSTRQNPNLPPRDLTNQNRSTSYYFNIYASGSNQHQFDLDYIAQGCQTIRLKYVPYHLIQTETLTANDVDVRRDPIWLLSGGDNCIHAYIEDKQLQTFNEVPIEENFPELSDTDCLTLWMDVINLEYGSPKRYERAIALGLEDGSIRLYHSSFSTRTNSFELIRKSSYDEYLTITPSVRLFQVNSNFQSDFKSKIEKKFILVPEEEDAPKINCLAVSSTNPSLIFENILESGLDCRKELPDSRRLDCSTSSIVADIDLDGTNEIIIGTYGRELLIYKHEIAGYRLIKVFKLNYPIYALSYTDLTYDGLKELVILMASGILVMQSPVQNVIQICKKRVDKLLEMLSL